MTLNGLMRARHLSAYRLSKESDVPYMTINDLINRKTEPTKCNAETVYKIARTLGTTVEELLAPYLEERPSFELFKSNVCHRLKERGDAGFLADLIAGDEITEYYDLGRYPECLYLLAMLDYISRVNGVPLCADYDRLRTLRLADVLYPSGVLAADMALKDSRIKEAAWKNAIPEFKRFNIVECEVRNVV